MTREAAGHAELFVDANGAFSVREAIHFLSVCQDADLRWFEEPVSADDAPGLRAVREAASGSAEIAAGEYTFNLDDAARLLRAEALNVLQADVTRCGGITGFRKVAALCEAWHRPLSGHCAPALHVAVASTVSGLRHLE